MRTVPKTTNTIPNSLRGPRGSPSNKKAIREAQRGDVEAMGDTTDTSPLFTARKKKKRPKKPDIMPPRAIKRSSLRG